MPSQTESNSETEILSRTALSEQIKDYIVEAILRADFKPGDRIVESNLARKLGVSQAPVREAVRDLVLLGFLEAEPFKGTSVRSFSPDELQEVYAVRAALEALSARTAATRLTEADVSTLRKILDEMIEAAQKRDAQQMVRLDNDFHETILQIAGNKLLYQLWKTLQFGFWTIVTTRISRFNLEQLAQRHEELLESLMSRDPEKAMQAMQRHIEDLGQPLQKSEGTPSQTVDNPAPSILT